MKKPNLLLLLLIFLFHFLLPTHLYSYHIWSGTKTISWTGSDPDGDPLTFSLYYSVTKYGQTGVIWNLIEKGIEGNSYEWDTKTVPNGVYFLRLISTDGSLEAEDIFDKPVEIRNAFLQAKIITPRDGSCVSGNIRVLGSADGDKVKEWFLEYSPVGTENWLILRQSSKGLSGGLLSRLDTTNFAPGNYIIRLRVYNYDLESRTNSVTITVDQESPLPPPYLSAKDLGIGDTVLLTWEASSSFDIKGYNLYRKLSGETNTKPILLPKRINEYTDAGLTLETYYYTITAVDQAGNESIQSNIATITLHDIKPPFIGLHDIVAFTNEAILPKVSGVYHDRDLKGITIEVRNKGDLVSRQLAYLPRGTLNFKAYDLTLSEEVNDIIATAEDTSGNTATVSQTVVLDTLPPEYVTLIEPTDMAILGRTVEFEWQDLNSDEENYTFQLSSVPFSEEAEIITEKIFDKDVTSYTVMSPEVLNDSKTYYWRVYASCNVPDYPRGKHRTEAG